MTLNETPPTSEMVQTPPPSQDLAGLLEKERADKAAAEGRLRQSQKDFFTLKTKADALEESSRKAESERIEHMRLKKAYASGVPSDLLVLVTGNTEAEIDAQIKTIQSQFAKVETPAPATPSADPANPAPVNQPAPRPAPVSQGGPSWLETYQAADPVTRSKMDRDVEAGKVKPW